jgi:hypothetical protein
MLKLNVAVSTASAAITRIFSLLPDQSVFDHTTAAQKPSPRRGSSRTVDRRASALVCAREKPIAMGQNQGSFEQLRMG